MNDLAKNLLLWVIVAVVLLAVFNSFKPTGAEATAEVPYSAFLDEVHGDAIKQVDIGEAQSGVTTLTFERKNGSKSTTTAPSDPYLVSDLSKHKVDFNQQKPGGGGNPGQKPGGGR